MMVTNKMSHPWSADNAMKAKLETAGWRYAILIGITGSAEEIEQYKDDQITYRHLIRKDDKGLSIWNCEEAAEFVNQVTGYPLEICDQWLRYDWP